MLKLAQKIVPIILIIAIVFSICIIPASAETYFPNQDYDTTIQFCESWFYDPQPKIGVRYIDPNVVPNATKSDFMIDVSPCYSSSGYDSVNVGNGFLYINITFHSNTFYSLGTSLQKYFNLLVGTKADTSRSYTWDDTAIDVQFNRTRNNYIWYYDATIKLDISKCGLSSFNYFTVSWSMGAYFDPAEEGQRDITFDSLTYYFMSESEYKDTPEYEEDYATDKGDDNTSAIDGAIPDQSATFMTAIKQFVGTMSYNGTDAVWTFPEVYIPEIENVIPKTKLIDKQNIDFGFWIQKLPSGVLSIVQILGTIGLIIFCFKELYGWIEYILTMRKGGGE